jgi:VanZ family protein
LLVAALIVAASHRPHLPAPQISHIDKITHFAVYGLLATLVCRAFPGRRGAMWTVVVVSAFGALDEWHQSFVPGRYPEVADWMADTLGAITAVLLYRAWSGYRRWLERPVHVRSAPGAGTRPPRADRV